MQDRKDTMGKRVLILEGSPRKSGNTDLLSAEFARGAKEAGHTVEKLYVNDLRIRGCQGCGACQRNGGICVQNDDMRLVYEYIATADVIVLASPVYFFSWTSQMKAVLDRTYALEPTLANKTFYLISAGAAPDITYMENMTRSYELYISCFRCGGIKNGGILYGLGASKRGDVKDSDAYAQAFAMGRTI